MIASLAVANCKACIILQLIRENCKLFPRAALHRRRITVLLNLVILSLGGDRSGIGQRLVVVSLLQSDLIVLLSFFERLFFLGKILFCRFESFEFRIRLLAGRKGLIVGTPFGLKR